MYQQYNCTKPCENINKKCSLNHKCEKMCYEDCSLCTVKVKRILECGHIKNDVSCGLNINEIKCILPCERPLKCDHKCQSKCYEKCKPCENQVSVKYSIICIHFAYSILFLGRKNYTILWSFNYNEM